ncbi:tetratricopeptide repeat protein [Fluviispira vulneris]|uniref:tetratricopeptide repeat protein n=1 Tax=Fluviispira vulneris TaxID=2763012 RepID=UPI001648DF8B|nr:tetratricopeptide repeat protein [Fluviispira vulneris]
MNSYKKSNRIYNIIAAVLFFAALIVLFVFLKVKSKAEHSIQMGQFEFTDSSKKLLEAATDMQIANTTEDPKLAQEYFAKALEKSPDDQKWGVYYNMGRRFLMTEEYNKAIEAFTKAIELNPQCAYCYGSRGDAYSDLNLYEKALQDIAKSIEIQPTHYAYYNRHYIYKNISGQRNKAIEDLKSAIALEKSFTRAYYSLIIMFINDNNLSEAQIYTDNYSQIVDSKNEIDYANYILIRSLLNLNLDKYELFLEYFINAANLNSKFIKEKKEQINYKTIKNMFHNAIILSMDSKNYAQALLFVQQALEAAQANNDNDKEYIDNLKLKIKNLEIIMKNT